MDFYRELYLLLYGFTLRARNFTILIRGLAWMLVLGLAVACNRPKLDEHGGYVDEKTGKYKYMRPKVSKPGYELGIKRPQEGEVQQIWGKVARVDADLKSVWLFIKDRHSYQMLADHIGDQDREDKDQNLKINLLYVNPLGSVPDPAFKRQWGPYAMGQMTQQFSGEQIYVTLHYKKKFKMFFGEFFKEIKTPEGNKLRNINQKIIADGLSFYFFNPEEKEPRKDLEQAQNLAKEQRAGLWNYE